MGIVHSREFHNSKEIHRRIKQDAPSNSFSKDNEKSQPQPQKKERPSIIDSGDENWTFIPEADYFRSDFKTACFFVMLGWVVKWHLNFVSCNFGLKSYLWFQIKLALRARSILKSCVWFQTKLHSMPLSSITIINQSKLSHWNPREKGQQLDEWDILVLFMAQRTLVKIGAVHSDLMQCILLKSDEFENSYHLVYILRKSWLNPVTYFKVSTEFTFWWNLAKSEMPLD